MIKMQAKGIDELISKLKKKRNTLDDKRKTFLERLALKGFEVADITFRNALYAGFNDVVVLEPRWKDESTIVLEAQGNAVAFIEFGTGIHYTPTDYPLDISQFPGIVKRGTYGKGKGGNKETKSWSYYGEPGNEGRIVRETKDGRTVVLTHGNPPAMAMYNASQKMRQREIIVSIAKEVFGSD